MSYVCLLKLLCTDGEIQIVVGSKNRELLPDIKEMCKQVSFDCTLQSKVTELFEFIDPLNLSEQPPLQDECDVGLTPLFDNVISNEIKLDILKENQNDNFYNQEDMAAALEATTVEATQCEDGSTAYILDISEVVDDDFMIDIDEKSDDADINPALLKQFVLDNYQNNKVASSQYTEELDVLLPDCYFHGVQTDMLKSIESENPFKCGICGEYYATLLDVRTHLRSNHKDNRNKNVYGCKYCDKLFSESCIIHHLCVHKKPYRCTHCEKSFSNQGNLKRHLLYVNGIYKHICTICGYRCISTNELKSHMVKHDSHLAHQCPKCGKIYARTSQLNRHLGTHNETRDYECHVCGKMYTTYYYLRTHAQTHNVNRPRKYSCTRCDKAYFKKENLVKHNSTYH